MDNEKTCATAGTKGKETTKDWKLSELPTREEFVKHFDDEGGVS